MWSSLEEGESEGEKGNLKSPPKMKMNDNENNLYSINAKRSTHPYGLRQNNHVDSFSHLSQGGLGSLGTSSFTHYLNEGYFENGRYASMVQRHPEASINGCLGHQKKGWFPLEPTQNRAFHLPTNKSVSLDSVDLLHDNRPTMSNDIATSVLDKPKVILPSIKRFFDEFEEENSYNVSVAESDKLAKQLKPFISPRSKAASGNLLNSVNFENSSRIEKTVVDGVHEDSFLTKKPENRCSTCNKTFKKPSTLKRHLITHTDSKPFVCAYCGRGFNVKHNLVRHNKRHDEITKQAAVNILITHDKQE